MERRLKDHLSSPPSCGFVRDRILDGQWPGLERKPVTLPSGRYIGLGVFACDRLAQGQSVSHYPDHGYLLLPAYLKLPHWKNSSVADYAQQVGTSGLSGWNKGPIVLLAHKIPVNQHFGHLINHSPCRGCQNVVHVSKLISGRPHLIFRARRTIDAGEQLLRDYGDEYHWPNSTIECPKCGKKKDIVTYNYVSPTSDDLKV